MLTFPPLTDLHTRRSAKWTLYDPDVLPMPVAEMDCLLAEPIRAALVEAVDRGDTSYPPMDDAHARAFTQFVRRRWDWRIGPGQVRPAADVSAAAVEVLRAGTTPGGRVVISSPVYPPFHRWPGETGTTLVDVPVLGSGSADDPYHLDLAGLEREFAQGAAAYVLCNPHNPLGHIYTREDLVALADLAAAHNVLVVADEIHAPLAFEPFVPFLSVSDAAAEIGVAIHSASKSWNLAGLKTAHIVFASETVEERLSQLPSNLPWTPGILGVIASQTAYTHGEPWLDELNRHLQANHSRLAEALERELPGARMVPARAGYLAWIDVGECGYGEHSEDPQPHILKVGRVALGRGLDFGETGRGHVRMNLGCAADLVDEGVRRMAAARVE